MIDKYISDDIAMLMIITASVLLSLLFFRIIQLYKQELRDLNAKAPILTEISLSYMQDFFENQLVSLRNEGGGYNFIGDENQTGLVAYYMIGAVEFLGKRDELSSVARRMLVIKLLQNNLGLCAKQVSKSYAGAKAICSTSSKDNPVKTGATACKDWLDRGAIADHLALSSLLA